MLSYGVCLTKAIRSSNIPMVQLLLESGLNPNACNKFGESIVHAACRRGDYNMLRVLIKAGSSVQISDDFGRTPLHDACWTSGPNFETISILLDLDPWLLSISDCRGSTPLSYVRKAHWALWIGFLGAIADKYWPCLNGLENSPINNTDNSSQNVDFDRPIVPPLSCLEPNSRPLPDPLGSLLTLEVVELIASGKLRPEGVTKKEASYKCEETKSLTFVDKEPPHRVGITVDPMMSRTSLVGQSFARVSSHI